MTSPSWCRPEDYLSWLLELPELAAFLCDATANAEQDRRGRALREIALAEIDDLSRDSRASREYGRRCEPLEAVLPHGWRGLRQVIVSCDLRDLRSILTLVEFDAPGFRGPADPARYGSIVARRLRRERLPQGGADAKYLQRGRQRMAARAVTIHVDGAQGLRRGHTAHWSATSAAGGSYAVGASTAGHPMVGVIEQVDDIGNVSVRVPERFSFGR